MFDRKGFGMNTLFILNGAPYGNEATHNGLRLAHALAERSDHGVRVYLMGDAVDCARSGQHFPDRQYRIETILQQLTDVFSTRVGVCGSCMDARGLHQEELVDGAHRGNLQELADWSVWADKVITF